MNLGTHVGDDAAAVHANRRKLAQHLGARPVFMNQVHGTAVASLGPELREEQLDGVTADACVTVARGLACTVLVADCLPILLARADGTAVAAAHAGWRGLAGVGGKGVVEAAVAALSGPGERCEVVAWLGPCIGPGRFEVGDDVRGVFSNADSSFVPNGTGKWLGNLPLLAREKLRDLGVIHINGNDGSSVWCTFTQTSRFFSHRRDAVRLGSTGGRMAACVWLA